MMLGQVFFAVISFRYIVLGAIDYAGVVSIIGAITAAVALYFGQRINKRTATNTETVSYVDTNLRTMQATLDWHIADNLRLRATNETYRLENEEQRQKIASLSDHIDTLENEIHDIEKELEKCKMLCSTLNQRINDIGDRDESR